MKYLLCLFVMLLGCVGCATSNPDMPKPAPAQVQSMADKKIVEADKVYAELKALDAEKKANLKFKALTKLLAEAKTLNEIKAFESLEKVLMDFFNNAASLKQSLTDTNIAEKNVENNIQKPMTESKKETLRIHVVKSGDTLYGLARQYYNNASQWRLIQAANKSQLGTSKTLKIGQKLEIPSLDN